MIPIKGYQDPYLATYILLTDMCEEDIIKSIYGGMVEVDAKTLSSMKDDIEDLKAIILSERGMI